MLIRYQSLLQNKSCTLDLAVNEFIDTSVRVVSKDYGDRHQTAFKEEFRGIYISIIPQ